MDDLVPLFSETPIFLMTPLSHFQRLSCVWNFGPGQKSKKNIKHDCKQSVISDKSTGNYQYGILPQVGNRLDCRIEKACETPWSLPYIENETSSFWTMQGSPGWDKENECAECLVIFTIWQSQSCDVIRDFPVPALKRSKKNKSPFGSSQNDFAEDHERWTFGHFTNLGAFNLVVWCFQIRKLSDSPVIYSNGCEPKNRGKTPQMDGL